jgi:uncharacterized protein (UPF0218 family)
MTLDEDLVKELKKPLGLLIPNDQITYERLLKYVEKTAMTISVGDCTSNRLITLGIIPYIIVVDGIEQRNKNIYSITSVERALNLEETISL